MSFSLIFRNLTIFLREIAIFPYQLENLLHIIGLDLQSADFRGVSVDISEVFVVLSWNTR